MATIKDVAKEAGVSIATVSCALSGTKTVKPETRNKIMKAVEKLKYVPNSSARNLKKTTSKVVSVVLPDMKSRMYTEVFDGLSSYMQSHGYSTNIAFSNGSGDIECERIDAFISQNTAGLLVVTSQPENTSFFQGHILDYHVPIVFMEREPEALSINYIGFRNYDAFYRLTEILLEKGYRDIAIICGPLGFSSEQQCVQGVCDALATFDPELRPSSVNVTNLTREDAFNCFIREFSSKTPEVLISTNREVTNGLQVAMAYCDLTIPEDLVVISYSEESWTDVGSQSGICLIPRSSSALGENAARILLQNMQNPSLFEQTITELDIPEEIALSRLPDKARKEEMRRALQPVAHPYRETLRFVAVNNPTVVALENLTSHFTRQTGIQVEYTKVSQKELFDLVSKRPEELTGKYDLYTYDIPWLEYMIQNICLADISSFAESEHFRKDLLLPESLKNCQLENRYFGIPLSGGTMLLFYRRDLFESRLLKEEYQRHSTISLRPPRTWKEFNDIAAFFTRSVNPSSPTEFGTSFAGSFDEELAPEILIRLWACGGRLWDNYHRPTFATKENQLAFESVLSTLQFTDDGDLNRSIHKTVEDFCSGKTAMLITYSEFAQQISQNLKANIIGKIAAHIVPGMHPASVGWNIGLNPFSPKRDSVFEFFSWICQVDTGYYLTILNGASPMKAPYHNYQLQKLYPWLSCTEQSLSCTMRRNSPYRKRNLILPPYQIEHIICQALRRTVNDHLSIEDALVEAQGKADHLFKMYGYPIIRKLQI